MRSSAILLLLLAFFVPTPVTLAQTKKTPPKKAAPAPKKAPAVVLTRVQATLACPSELGQGVKTGRRFCDVLAGTDPQQGVLVTIPPHRGTVQLSFELHNRHTYSEDLVKAKTAFRKYTASVGIWSLDGVVLDRAVIQSEFRGVGDLFDRISGGVGPGGRKAVAPTGTEFITVELAEDVGEQVSLLGEKLTVLRPDGTDNFVSAGRPVATISNMMVEYRPGPPPKKAPVKKR